MSTAAEGRQPTARTDDAEDRLDGWHFDGHEQEGVQKDGGQQYMPHPAEGLIGPARARGLAMLAEPLGAEMAAEWGLIWKAVDDDSLMAEAQETARGGGGDCTCISHRPDVSSWSSCSVSV